AHRMRPRRAFERHGAQRIIDVKAHRGVHTPSATPTRISSMTRHPEMEPMSAAPRAIFLSATLAFFAASARAETPNENDPFGENKPVQAEASADVHLSTTAPSAPSKEWSNERALEMTNTLGGSTGLLHTLGADPGGNGTLRASVI